MSWNQIQQGPWDQNQQNPWDQTQQNQQDSWNQNQQNFGFGYSFQQQPPSMHQNASLPQDNSAISYQPDMATHFQSSYSIAGSAPGMGAYPPGQQPPQPTLQYSAPMTFPNPGGTACPMEASALMQPQFQPPAQFSMPPPLPRRVQELNPHTGFAAMPSRMQTHMPRAPYQNSEQNITYLNQNTAQHSIPNYITHFSHPNPFPHYQSNCGAELQQYQPQPTIISRPSPLKNLAIEFRVPRSPGLPFMPHPPKSGERNYRGRGPHTFDPNPPDIKDQYEEARRLEMQRVQRVQNQRNIGEERKRNMALYLQSQGLTGNEDDSIVGGGFPDDPEYIAAFTAPEETHPGIKDSCAEPAKITSPWGEGNTGRDMEAVLLDVQRQAGMPRIQAAGQILQAAVGNPSPMTYKEEEPFLNWETPRVPTEWDVESEPEGKDRSDEDIEEAVTERIDANLAVKRGEVDIYDGEMQGMVKGMTELTRYPPQSQSTEDKENQFQPHQQAVQPTPCFTVVSFKNSVGFRHALETTGASRKKLHGISFWDQRPDPIRGYPHQLMRHFWMREGYQLFQLELDYTSNTTGSAEKWLAFHIECSTAEYKSRTNRRAPSGFPTETSWVVFGFPASHVEVHASTQQVVPVGESVFSVMLRLVNQEFDIGRGSVPLFEFSKGDEAFLTAGCVDAGTRDWVRRLEINSREDRAFWERMRAVMASGNSRIITTVEGGGRIGFGGKGTS